MRLLVVQLDRVHPPVHGSAAAAWRVLTALARQGHEAHLLTLLRADRGGFGQPLDELAERGVAMPDGNPDAVRFVLDGVVHHGVGLGPQGAGVPAAEIIANVNPDLVLVSDEPILLAWSILANALAWRPERVVLWSHTLHHLPFGPLSLVSDPGRTALVERCRQVLTPSHAATAYVRAHSQAKVRSLRLPLPGLVSPSDTPGTAITMINPCALKGGDVFYALADALPNLPFLAVPGWGTQAADREALAARNNMEVMPWARDVGTVYRRSRLLVVPSVWFETFGLAALEAMAAGVPVVSSDSGGLPEAKAGVPWEVKVTLMSVDPTNQRPIFHQQDMADWVRIVARAYADETEWAHVREQGMRVAGAYQRQNDEQALVEFFHDLLDSSSRPPVG